MNLTENRIDSSLLSELEKAMLKPMVEFAHRSSHPSLKSREGTEIPIPQALFDMLIKVVEDMMRGRAVVLLPEDETFTTQAASNYLGMSRQYFVTLLESGQIPFHRVGTHRRVYFRDLLDFASTRDKSRKEGLNRLFTKVNKAGLYDAGYKGGE